MSSCRRAGTAGAGFGTEGRQDLQGRGLKGESGSRLRKIRLAILQGLDKHRDRLLVLGTVPFLGWNPPRFQAMTAHLQRTEHEGCVASRLVILVMELGVEKSVAGIHSVDGKLYPGVHLVYGLPVVGGFTDPLRNARRDEQRQQGSGARAERGDCLQALGADFRVSIQHHLLPVAQRFALVSWFPFRSICQLLLQCTHLCPQLRQLALPCGNILRPGRSLRKRLGLDLCLQEVFACGDGAFPDLASGRIEHIHVSRTARDARDLKSPDLLSRGGVFCRRAAAHGRLIAAVQKDHHESSHDDTDGEKTPEVHAGLLSRGCYTVMCMVQ